MKKVWFMLAMMVCILASCSDGGSDNPVEPTPKPEEIKTEITIDSGIVSNGLSFGVEGGGQSVSFSVNANWTLSVASTTSGATWCKASATSGSKGAANVKFTVDENTGYDDRSVSVTIKAGSVSKTFTITQKGADALLVTADKYEIAQEGGQIEIEVKANIDYQMEISGDAKSWITEASSRALTTYKHTLDIALNEDAEKREGEITFKSGDKVETVKVYQAGGALIMLSQNEYTVSDAGETISVDIKSNVEYGVQMPDVDWITDEASSRGMSSHTLKYVIAPNEGYDARSAEIIFYDKNSDLKDTLKVTQAQKDAIVISEKNISVAKEGGTVEVKINTNVDFEVQIPSDATWVTRTESRALTERSVYLKVAENTGEGSRSANITITNQDSQLSETITITQQGNISVVALKEAGTMKKLLGDDYLSITSLKVVGPINGDDVYYLRKMLGGYNFSEADWGKLATLDLSEATIVEGGEWYLSGRVVERTEYYLEYSNVTEYTSNNEIGDYMFYGCTNLQNMILPRNVTSIDCSAFYDCAALTTIEIGNGVTSIGYDAFYGCSALANVHITDLFAWCNIDFYGSYDNPIYSNPLCYGAKLYLNNREVVDLVIPDGITEVMNNTFKGCVSIKTVKIPDSVTTIGRKAFYGCAALTTVEIGNGVTSIGSTAFYDCAALTTIRIPDNVTSIGYSAFYGCAALTTIKIPDNVTSIGSSAFQGCAALTTVEIGNGVTSIVYSVFQGCAALTTVEIGNGVTWIAGNAFYGCSINVCYCYATTSPSFGDGLLFSVEKDATLYVPARCGAAYKSSTWGRLFKNIVEMD